MANIRTYKITVDPSALGGYCWKVYEVAVIDRETQYLWAADGHRQTRWFAKRAAERAARKHERDSERGREEYYYFPL